jgi:hypothetical protein
MMTSILLPQLLPLDSVKLGRFVTRFDQPHQNYHDPPSQHPPHDHVFVVAAYTGEHQTTGHSAFGTTLTSLMSASYSKRAGAKFCVATDCLKTHALDNSDSWFDDVTSLSGTRSWIERAIDRGEDTYLIVGFHTITNAKISNESIVGNSMSVEMNLPAALSLAAAGIVLPLATPLDPGVGAQRKARDSSRSEFVVPGEQVCALQYRKVRHKWLSSKRLNKARLSAMRQWSSMETSRDEEEGEDDVIEVELAEVESPGEGWDQENAGSESIFVSSGKEL